MVFVVFQPPSIFTRFRSWPETTSTNISIVLQQTLFFLFSGAILWNKEAKNYHLISLFPILSCFYYLYFTESLIFFQEHLQSDHLLNPISSFHITSIGTSPLFQVHIEVRTSRALVLISNNLKGATLSFLLNDTVNRTL